MDTAQIDKVTTVTASPAAKPHITSPSQLSPAQLSLIVQAKTLKKVQTMNRRGHQIVRVALGAGLSVALYFLNQYLTVRLTYAGFIAAINKGLKTTGNPLGGNLNGTVIAMAFTSGLFNWLRFNNAPSFATAVGYSYYTQEFASEFNKDMPGKIIALYEQARLNPEWSPLKLVCNTFGRPDGATACQQMCQPPAPSNVFGAIGSASSFGLNGFFVGGPIGLGIGALVGLGLYYGQAYTKYQKCIATQTTCITTKETECRF